MGTISAFDDWFARNMPDVEAWAAQFAAEPVAGRPDVVPMCEPLAWTRRAESNPIDTAAVSALNAHKLTSYIDVPDELLMADGLIPDTRPLRPPLPWRWRLRSKITGLRERAARRAYKTIAGDWPDSREDDW